LNLTPIQHVRIQSDLDTLTFAQSQIALLEETPAVLAAQDKRVLLLIQLPGIGLITAMTLVPNSRPRTNERRPPPRCPHHAQHHQAKNAGPRACRPQSGSCAIRRDGPR